MHVGSDLERARQSHGLSLEELARRTKISALLLDVIERGDVELLPAPADVRGFVQAYAAEVGLDPDDVASRYLAQFEEPSFLAEFDSEASAEFDSEEVAVADSEEPALAASRGETRSTPPLPPASSEKAGPLWRPAEYVSPPGHGREAEPAASSGRTSGSGAPFRHTRSTSRFGVTAVAVAAASVITGFVVSANLHRLWSVSESLLRVATSTSDTATPAKPQGDVSPVVAESHDAGDATPDRPALANLSPVEDLSGAWSFTTRVESTSLDAYKGLSLGFRVQLEQQDSRVAGAGYKTTENGRSLASGHRTPIKVEGTLNGRRLELRFTEIGARRTSDGTFTLAVADDGSMRGSFSSDAAQSRGSVQATRVPL